MGEDRKAAEKAKAEAEAAKAKEEAEKIVNDIIDMLTDIGYSGLFDFELFELNDGGYLLNEINFRNSGNTWALIKNGLNIPYIWVKDAEGEDISVDNSKEAFEKEKYFMNEKQTTSTPSEKPGMRGIKKKFYEKEREKIMNEEK